MINHNSVMIDGFFFCILHILLILGGSPSFLARKNIALAHDMAELSDPLPRSEYLQEGVLQQYSKSREEKKLLCSAFSNVTSHFEKFGQVTLTDQNYPNGLHKKFSPKTRYRNRISLIKDISRQGLRGYAAELGVAKGSFSRAILKNSNFKRVFSIDAWELGTRFHRQSREMDL